MVEWTQKTAFFSRYLNLFANNEQRQKCGNSFLTIYGMEYICTVDCAYKHWTICVHGKNEKEIWNQSRLYDKMLCWYVFFELVYLIVWNISLFKTIFMMHSSPLICWNNQNILCKTIFFSWFNLFSLQHYYCPGYCDFSALYFSIIFLLCSYIKCFPISIISMHFVNSKNKQRKLNK